MTRIAIVNVGAHGHVNPTLPVVGELVRRGAEVSYFVTEEFKNAVLAEGARFEGFESDFGKVPPGPGVTTTDLLAQMPGRLTGECLKMTPQIEGRLKAFKPDVILYDNFCLAARLLTKEMKVKAATLLPTYAMNERFSLIGFVKPEDMPPENHPLLQEFRVNAQQIKSRFGVEFTQMSELFRNHEPLNICFVAKPFQYANEVFDSTFEFVGPCIAKRPTAGTWNAAGDPRPLVLVSLGTVFNAWPEFFGMCFDAFAGAPYRVVMAVGNRIDPATLGKKTENVALAAHVPQLEVLEKTKVFVTHGGMNSTMESLYFGVPMVVIPQMMEQAATARRVAELGLGKAFPRETITAQNLREAVDFLINDAGTRTRVEAMQQAVRASGGQIKAASAILAYAGSPPKAHSTQATLTNEMTV